RQLPSPERQRSLARPSRPDQGARWAQSRPPTRIALALQTNSAPTESRRARLPGCRFEMYGAKDSEQLTTLQSMGFDQVTVQSIDMARLADSMNLSVVLENWWNKDTPWDEIKAVVQSARTIRHLVSINMIDE